jgi:hypothetical protein
LTGVPRFYFDVRDGASFTPDDEGLKFPGTHQARVEASRALAEMIKDSMPNGSHKQMAIEVRGENRKPLLKVQITFEVEPLAKAPRSANAANASASSASAIIGVQ